MGWRLETNPLDLHFFKALRHHFQRFGVDVDQNKLASQLQAALAHRAAAGEEI